MFGLPETPCQSSDPHPWHTDGATWCPGIDGDGPNPPIRYAPGSVYSAHLTYRLWTVEHVDYDTARKLGQVSAVEGEHHGYVGSTPLRVHIYPTAQPLGSAEAAAHPLDGLEVASIEEGERALYAAGLLGFRETLRSTAAPTRPGPVKRPDPEDDYVPADEAGARADAAAADMAHREV